MAPVLVRLLVASAVLVQISEVAAFTSTSQSCKNRSCFPSSHQLGAFQVSPFLRFRNDGPTNEDTTSPRDNTVINQGTRHAGAQQVGRQDQSTLLIRAILLNQAAIFLLATAMATLASFLGGSSHGLASLHWNSGLEFRSLFDWNINELRLLEGILATIPMIVIGNSVEKSERRDASHVNFSTVNMVISLFGRRKSYRDPEATSSSMAMTMAAVIAISTGLSEEIVFRGYLPTAIESVTQSLPLALMGQAVLFAVAHMSPKALPEENKVIGSLQLMNGLWYGIVYMASGGDIVPCIIAHVLYDMHVLCATWCGINKQMDYTQDAFQQELDGAEIEALGRIKQRAGPSLSTDTLDLARRFFYAFDYEHKGSLCLADVHRAVTYAFLQDQVVPEPEEVDDAFDFIVRSRDPLLIHLPARLTVSEFLRLLFTLKSKGAFAL